MKKKNQIWAVVLLLTAVFFASPAKAQVTIGENAAPTPGAVLDLRSNDKLGLLMPQVALTSATVWAPVTGAAVEGMTVFNTSTSTANGLDGKGIYTWMDSKWVKAGGGSGSGSGMTTNVIIQNLVANYSPAASVFSAFETFIIGVGSNAATTTLPDLTLADKGKRVYVANNTSSGNAPVNFTPPSETDGSPAAQRTYSVTNKTTQGFYWTGSVWVVMGK